MIKYDPYGLVEIVVHVYFAHEIVAGNLCTSHEISYVVLASFIITLFLVIPQEQS